MVAFASEDGLSVRVRVGEAWVPFGPDPEVFARARYGDVLALEDRACVTFIAQDVADERVGVLCHPWP